jgi:CHAT domain-containing protein
MQLAKLDPAGDFAKRAFEASERSKVRSLLDLLTTSGQDASCNELLARQLPSPDSTAHSREVPRDVVQTAPTLTLEEVQAEIEDSETILLEYALGEETSFVWAVGRNQISSYELPRSDRVRKLVRVLREALVPPRLERQESASDYQARVRKVDRAYEAHSRELSKILLGPVDLTRSKRLLIVSDGSLQYVPFAALPLPGPEGHPRPLVDRYEINMLPSASVLGTVRKATATRAAAPATLAVFADPVFEPDDQRIPVHRLPSERSQERPHSLDRTIRDTGGSQYIPRLPASRDEAKAIAAVFRSLPPATVHIALDFDANREYVLRGGLGPFRLIHFATHGVVDARQPEMSGLILSLVDTHGRRVDGYLRMGDVYKLTLAADLVVLSSCDSALGKDLESEGIIGLPRAFLYAGARSVIASLWKVNDEATAKLMSALYARVASGQSPGAALRQAQLEMVNSDRWSKPYYWAAFALQGDYR